MRNKLSTRKSSQEDKIWSFCYIDNTELNLSLLFQPNISKVNGCSTELTESIEIMGLKNNLPNPVFVINFSLTFRSDMLNLCIRRELKECNQTKLNRNSKSMRIEKFLFSRWRKNNKANTSSGSHRKNQTREYKKQKKNKIQNIRLGKIGDHICTNKRIKRYQENAEWRIWNTGANDFDSRDTAKETSVEILKLWMRQ